MVERQLKKVQDENEELHSQLSVLQAQLTAAEKAAEDAVNSKTYQQNQESNQDQINQMM
jgi:cell division septum initiation protein DivIVA